MANGVFVMLPVCLQKKILNDLIFEMNHLEGNNSQHNAVAAHWIPDDKADTCMHCHTSKFSAVNRRHVINPSRVTSLYRFVL